MTTSRLVIERITVDCVGAAVAIELGRDVWSGRDQLYLEIVTTDQAGGDTDQRDESLLTPYCPEPARSPDGEAAGPRRLRPAVLATAVATIALLAVVAGAQVHSASTGSATPTTVPIAAPAGGDEPGPAGPVRVAVASPPADLAGRCNEMIEMASAALGIDADGLLHSLVANHEGQTLNDAVHQELTDARAVLVSRLSGADTASAATAIGVDALDTAIADADATPCSAGGGSQTASTAANPSPRSTTRNA